MPGHLRSTKVWLPSWLIFSSISLCMTRMAVITTMMEKTPTSTPSSVSAERNLWEANAPKAMRKLSRNSAASTVQRAFGRIGIPFLFVPQRIHRVHAGGAPGGEEPRENPSHQRYQQSDADDGR